MFDDIKNSLWATANMDAAEYKHLVLGLIFIKYILDNWENAYRLLVPSSPETVVHAFEEVVRACGT